MVCWEGKFWIDAKYNGRTQPYREMYIYSIITKYIKGMCHKTAKFTCFIPQSHMFEDK